MQCNCIYLIVKTSMKKGSNNNNKVTYLAQISSDNPNSVAQQNQRIRHSRDYVQCEKSETDGWTCQEAKEDRQY